MCIRDRSLGPEMKSTGEVLGISTDYDEAIYKAFIGTGIQLSLIHIYTNHFS